MIQVGHEAGRLLLDDPHGGGPFSFALQAVALAGLAKIIDRIQVHAQPLADGRVEIARDRQVQNEQRALLAGPLDGEELVQRDNGLRGGGGADHQVCLGQLREQLLPCHGLSAPGAGQLFGFLEATIDDAHVAGAFVLEIAERFFGHFAGADDQHPLVVKRGKDLLGEIGNGDAGNADPLFVDAGLAGYPLGHAQRGLKHLVGQRAGALAVASQLIGLFDLGHDVRLAHNHAVQAGRDVEQVAHDVFAGAFKQVVEDVRQIEAVKIGQELGHLLVAGDAGGGVGGGVDLDPVAGRQDHRFGRGKALAQAGQGVTGLLGIEGQPAAYFDRGRVMAETANLVLHAAPPDSRRRGVGGGQWAVGSWQSAEGSWQWGVGSKTMEPTSRCSAFSRSAC